MRRNFFIKIKTFLLLLPVFFIVLLMFPSCKKSVDYFDYVSELRSNIFLAEQDGYSLRIYTINKESPYAADGIVREKTDRIEFYLIAPDGGTTCEIKFTANEKTYQEEMSFDNVKAEYYFFCSEKLDKTNTIDCQIQHGEQTVSLVARSVLDGKELSPKTLLQSVQAENQELFQSLTDKYGFQGEIYMRLLFEESTYYYVGIIDRNGKIYAFLLNAHTGKILAKRTP